MAEGLRRLLCTATQSPPPVTGPSPLMRNRNNKEGFILDLEQEVEREAGKHTLPDWGIEEGKRLRRTRNPRFRVLYGSQESPSKTSAARFVEPG